MPDNNHPFPGQTLARTYMSQRAYQKDANKLARRGWSVQSTTMHDIGGRFKLPEVLVTYVYRPSQAAPQTFTPLVIQQLPYDSAASQQMTAPPPQGWMTVQPIPSRALHHYALWEAGLVTALLVLGIALSSLGIGVAMLLAGIIYAAIRDGYGLLSMRKLFPWERASRSGKTWIVVALVFLFPIFAFIYSWMIVFDAFQFWKVARADARRSMRQRTAELESQLGIVPDVQGECRKCQKPLQVGAEYCAYCGEPVVLRPRICPVCASTALPDAKFCPKCRAELPPAI